MIEENNKMWGHLYPKGRKSLKWVEKKEGEPRGNLPVEVKIVKGEDI